MYFALLRSAQIHKCVGSVKMNPFMEKSVSVWEDDGGALRPTNKKTGSERHLAQVAKPARRSIEAEDLLKGNVEQTPVPQAADKGI
jgi:hypothetical protein